MSDAERQFNPVWPHGYVTREGREVHMTYQIEKDIPLPKRRANYPFGTMEIGDSFAMPLTDLKNVRCAAQAYGRRNNKKFRSVREGDHGRIWREA